MPSGAHPRHHPTPLSARSTRCALSMPRASATPQHSCNDYTDWKHSSPVLGLAPTASRAARGRRKPETPSVRPASQVQNHHQ
jgi:hypothetical protein